MKKLLLMAMLVVGMGAAAQAEVRIHVNIGPPPYYGYAPREVVYVQRYVPAYDVPRVFLFAQYAGLPPATVVSLYRRGWGWDRMCGYYGVPRQAFYGHGHYKAYKHHGRGWYR